MSKGKVGEKLSVVEVIPVLKGLAKPSLSYFTSLSLKVGDTVKVEVRNKKVPAIVRAVKSPKALKTDLRNSSFTLRKISSQSLIPAYFPAAFLKAAELTAAYYATSTGEILNSLIPKIVLDDPSEYYTQYIKEDKNEISREILLVQLGAEERLVQYRALVRQSLARDHSLMIVTPTNEDAERLYEQLSRGIKDFVYLLTARLGRREFKRIWSEARDSSHPVLFITTQAGLSFDRADLRTLIVERENSRSFRTFSRPYINIKVFLEYFAKESKKQLIYGDTVLSVESLHKEEQEKFRELTPLKWRLTAPQSSLVELGTEKKENGQFQIFSPELKRMLEEAVNSGKGVFLFGARKGLAPVTICRDCGTLLTCKNCNAPMVLYTSGIFRCHACGAERGTQTTCGHCGGWDLMPLGIGVDRIVQEAKKLFPKVAIHILDKDHAPNKREAHRIVEEFEKDGGILVGTEMALSYIDKVPYSGVVSLDALFAIPDFSIEERIFYLLSHLREVTVVESIIQSRNVGKRVLTWANLGSILDFYRTELEEREKLMYPPYSLFIKITSPRIKEIVEEFAPWQPDIVKDSLVMRCPRDSWPDPLLISKLLLLTPDFLIKVDPESIL